MSASSLVQIKNNGNPSRVYVMLLVLIVAVIAGLCGTLLVLMLRGIQHLAFGYSERQLISPISFLEGVSAASPTRRLLILSACGLVAGLGWWLLFRYGKPLVSIDRALTSDPPNMPKTATLVHVVLQIVTVGLGSPLGREVAPRELAAVFACWFGDKLKLLGDDRRLLVACAAGGGLAAVYNVPLGGALFTLEVLLKKSDTFSVIAALLTGAMATAVSWIGLGNHLQYTLPPFIVTPNLIAWALVCGPIFGAMAYVFNRITNSARQHAPHDTRVVYFCLINFFLIGLLSTNFPSLLGNGKSPILLSFVNALSLQSAALLLVMRFIIVWGTLRAGATGGLLTPSLANGALLAIMLGHGWSFAEYAPMSGVYAVIGAGAFLASSNQMPITAIILVLELTGNPFILSVPLMIAVAGSVFTCRFCTDQWRSSF